MENGIGLRQSLMEILGLDQGWVRNEDNRIGGLGMDMTVGRI